MNDYVPSSDEIQHVHATLQMMSVMTGDRRFEEAYDPIEGRVHNMCEVLGRIENRGYNSGVDHVSKIVIANLYKRGNTVHDIADILALEESQIERMLEEMGLERC